MKEDILEIDRATEPYTFIYISSLEKLGNEIKGLNHKVERLQEQLKEANEILKSIIPMDLWNDGAKILDYLAKWGVK